MALADITLVAKQLLAADYPRAMARKRVDVSQWRLAVAYH